MHDKISKNKVEQYSVMAEEHPPLTGDPLDRLREVLNIPELRKRVILQDALETYVSRDEDVTLKALAEGLAESKLKIAVIYLSTEKYEELLPRNLYRNPEDTIATLHYTLYKGKVIGVETPCDQLLILGGTQQVQALWERFHAKGVKNISPCNFTYGKDWSDHIAAPLLGTSEITSLPRFCRCNDTQFLTIFENTNAPVMSKLMTAMVSSYPWTLTELKVYGDYIDYSEFCEIYHIEEDTHVSDTMVEVDTLVKSYLAVAILLPAYSDEKNSAGQIHRRVKAACTTYGAAYPDEADISRATKHFATSNRNLPNSATGVLAALVARDKHLKFDLDVKAGELADITDLLAVGHPDGFLVQLFTQAQMVYDGFHKSTIHFVLELHTIAKAHNVCLGSLIDKEEPAVVSLKTKVEGRPYVAMTPTQATALRVAQFPSTAYMALQYRLNSIKDPEEKKKFEQYNFEGVSTHLKSSSDKQALLARVRSVPDPTLADILDQVQHATAAQVDSYLSFTKLVSEEALYDKCLQTNTTGPWFVREDQKVKALTRLKYQEAYSKHATQVVRDHINRERDAAMAMERKVDRNKRIAELSQLEARLYRTIRDTVSVEDLLRSSSKREDSELLEDYKKKYEDLLAELEDDTAGDEDTEGEEGS